MKKQKKVLESLARFGPRQLAIVLGIFGVILATVAYYPISQAFSRNWKLNQFFTVWSDFHIDSLNFGDINIRFYSLCILLGVLLGYAMALYLSKLNFVVGSIVDRLLVGLVVFGLLGARLFYVLFNLDIFASKPQAILTEIGSGGMAVSGSILFGILYIKIYTDRYKFNFFEFLDFLAPAVLIGQIFGRFGNFFNYEAYGPETSVLWKMYVPDAANLYGDINSRFFHPTFLYEIIPNSILLLVLLWNYKSNTEKNSGLVFAQYAMGYGLIRVMVEFFRLDALKLNLPFPIQLGFVKIDYLMSSQLFGLALAGFGYYIYTKRSRIIYLKKQMKELYL